MPVGAASWSFTEDDFAAITESLTRFLHESSARCTICKRMVAAIRDAAGKVVVLPHSATGAKVEFGQTCKAKR